MLRIRELEQDLFKKEQDLILAGEIGSRILQEKIELENSLKVKSLKIQELENVIQELELDIQNKQEDIAKTKHSIKNLEKKCTENDKQVYKLQIELEIAVKETEKFRNLKHSLDVSIKEIYNESEKLKVELNKMNSEKQEIYAKYVENSLQLEENYKSKQELSAKLKEIEQENSILKGENANQKENIFKLEKELEFLKFEVENFQDSRVEIQKENVEFSFGSSLLGEIDEKRIQAEIEAKESNEKHQGLLKNYNLIERQKERMKNHISRLTQLSQKQSAEHRLLILEGELSQALSENQDLKEKLHSFKHSRSSSDESLELEEKSLVSKLLQENTRLTQEIKTLHMLKLNEADKVRSAYSLLHVKEQELDGLRSQFAQVKFELDEANLKLGNPDLMKDDLNGVEVLENVSDDCSDDSPESPQKSLPESLDVDGSSKTTVNSSFQSDEEIQKVIQSLSGVSTPSSGSELPCGSGESCIQNQNKTHQSSRNIKVDRAKIGQECNQQ